ncbi:modification target Cys-rich repeat protein [Rhodopseudomonas julia]|uniref:Modification target Cys-rich repeat protein n=1 Tax=Rhodopseudomonas julia TaxID=200617 RepID=A0ABU0C3A3_9BRAD|nr:hypothetical protein [Rhodopseudomonas julia]MDQ0324993.1 modification target Cys-rich repeat protein [Rhodopseudomonas julia]
MHKTIEISEAELEELRQASRVLEKVLGARMEALVEASHPVTKGCQGCSGACEGTCAGSCAGSCKGGCKGSCNAICSTVCTMLGS